MSTCKDCIHDNICPKAFASLETVGDNCNDFKNRSKFVELPYTLKPKDKVWYILEDLDELSLKDYKTTSGNCAVGETPDTVIDMCTKGFFTNAILVRNEDYLSPDDCDFIPWDEIGKSYFLTIEEAVQALKEREKNETETSN